MGFLKATLTEVPYTWFKDQESNQRWNKIRNLHVLREGQTMKWLNWDISKSQRTWSSLSKFFLRRVGLFYLSNQLSI